MPEKAHPTFVKLLLQQRYNGVYQLSGFHCFEKGEFEVSRLEDAKAIFPAWCFLLEERFTIAVTGKAKIDKKRHPVALVRDIREYEHMRSSDFFS